MNPVYTDLHIHTSNDSTNLNENYDVQFLLEKIKNYSKTDNILISLTDHNRINKSAYLKLIGKVKFLIGVEVHVRNFEDCSPYHCHLYFNVKDHDLEEKIDHINLILKDLYPNPMPSKNDNIPNLFNIVNRFNDYEMLILPHGGQSHATFDVSIPNDVKFDKTMEQNIYYNLFDGFTSRSNSGLERTQSYFDKLGISEFINLLTCTDNYNPGDYPSDKNKSQNFVPTWIYSLPTFDGLRVSLSERTRMFYGEEPPRRFQEKISSCQLVSEHLNIDVEFSEGLNVVIGNSSSGKTLLVNSIYNKIQNEFKDSVYESEFQVSNINVTNVSGITPHYFSQNYILEITKDEKKGLENVEILHRVFPQDEDVTKAAEKYTNDLRTDINNLINAVEKIEDIQKKIKTISVFARLIVKGDKKTNILNFLEVDEQSKTKLKYLKTDYDSDIKKLDDLMKRQSDVEFIEDFSKEVLVIKSKLKKGYDKTKFENKLRIIINEHIKAIEEILNKNDQETLMKRTDWNNLMNYLSEYRTQLDIFYDSLDKLSTNYDYKIQTQEIDSSGHKLYIENNFKITKNIILQTINDILRTNYKINNFEELKPADLFLENFKKQSPKIDTYLKVKENIVEKISINNKVVYKIKYKGVKNFDDLSPGLKTSVILDIILNYDKDFAPLIIDQPEDNLATNYLNHGLISSIKDAKVKRQLIIVTHNATIPMLGDAYKIIVCDNDMNKIKITSHFLEDEYGEVKITDKIAELTDGGKINIKKRFKKYNLRNYKGENNEIVN